MNLPLQMDIERKAYQRSLRLKVLPNGLVKISCPKNASDKALTGFVTHATPYVRKHLQRLQKIRSALPQPLHPTSPWIPWQGEKLSIIRAEGFSQPVLQSEGLVIDPACLNHKVLRAFYKSQAQEMLTTRAEMWSRAMDLRPRRLAFRGQRSRWGSCSAEGSINLNWKLMIAPPEVVDYVIIHELAHLRVLNHGPRFWELVERFQPHRKTNEKWLRLHQQWAEFLEPDSLYYEPLLNLDFLSL